MTYPHPICWNSRLELFLTEEFHMLLNEDLFLVVFLAPDSPRIVLMEKNTNHKFDENCS